MNDVEFGFRIRQALNEGAEALDYKTAFRLAKARSAALDLQHASAPAMVRLPALRLAVAGGAPLDAPGGGLLSWLRGMGLAAPLVVLAVGFVGIYEWHNRQHIAELADFDFAVLLDDAPIEAYADRSFGALLQRNPPADAASQ
jgi:hypothetical protein